ncbi:hypothetical protein FRC19_009550 [Serendipita sp. 401]|nr:hypothetical protein FRC18_006445 [Serendipita sp. 400]KAG8826200.1 hypothetical protein FRC19_009550 [Serendipita sp. 401]KAG9056992.1 hypothetical protein FS842_009018 [Serendipita sp. 407]
MGAAPSNALASLKQPTTKNEARILILGFGSGGKTTVLYRIKLGEVITTIPTVGYNSETIEYKGIALNLWDIPSNTNPILFKHIFQNTDGVIFVVDSADESEFGSAKECMDEFLAHELLQGCPLLVLANKQDLPNSVDPNVLISKLDLMSRRDNEWFIYPCSAVTGEGLFEGLEWMGNTIRRLRKLKTIASAQS